MINNIRMRKRTEYFVDLDNRRRAAGMSYAVLAQRSGVSVPTVVRILSGSRRASFANVAAIAEALGLSINFAPRMTPRQLMVEGAREKAKKLAGMVQATSGLESQALSPEELEELADEMANRLLGGTPRNVWGD